MATGVVYSNVRVEVESSLVSRLIEWHLERVLRACMRMNLAFMLKRNEQRIGRRDSHCSGTMLYFGIPKDQYAAITVR